MANNGTAPGTTIMDLPQELIVRIGSFLSTAELGPLRRSCKQIEASLFDNFASEFFTKRQFMIEHNSLEALVGIANHPGLAARLTEVLIGTQALDGLRLEAKEDFLAGRLKRELLLSSGKARDMLVDAFSKLPNLRIVGLRDYNGAGRVRDGLGARWRSWGWTAASHTHEASPDPLFPLIVSALSLANAHPENFEVILRKSQLGTDALIAPDISALSTTQTPLASLKVLFLAVSYSRDTGSHLGAPWQPYDDTQVADAPLKRFLHSVSALEHLRLNFVSNQFLAHRFLGWLVKPALSSPAVANQLPVPPVDLPNLTTLDLGMATAPSRILLGVLTRFNLKSFSLWKMTIQAQDTSKDCWSEFLVELSSRLPDPSSLRKIMIGNVSQHRFHDSSALFQPWTRVSFVAEGTDLAKKEEAAKILSVEFKAQYTGKTVHEWLNDMAELTFVPGIHTRIEQMSESESEEDDGEEEFDEDEEVEDDDLDEDE